VGVITMLVFLVCRYDDSTYGVLDIVNIQCVYVVDLLVWIINTHTHTQVL
jgi:hypothetical protein